MYCIYINNCGTIININILLKGNDRLLTDLLERLAATFLMLFAMLFGIYVMISFLVGLHDVEREQLTKGITAKKKITSYQETLKILEITKRGSRILRIKY